MSTGDHQNLAASQAIITKRPRNAGSLTTPLAVFRAPKLSRSALTCLTYRHPITGQALNQYMGFSRIQTVLRPRDGRCRNRPWGAALKEGEEYAPRCHRVVTVAPQCESRWSGLLGGCRAGSVRTCCELAIHRGRASPQTVEACSMRRSDAREAE